MRAAPLASGPRSSAGCSFCFPSRLEGQGLKLVAAQEAVTPPKLSRVGEAKERTNLRKTPLPSCLLVLFSFSCFEREIPPANAKFPLVLLYL
ncbi:hypothetical protein VNO77_44170 [Canavalia gladiata]|uniref:Uncharacterized protein n=1 Tax=Canavalia gladiata TaxID=3824 RepID=A0AAN9PQ47_CANGL